jgi:hypothetical protein
MQILSVLWLRASDDLATIAGDDASIGPFHDVPGMEKNI